MHTICCLCYMHTILWVYLRMCSYNLWFLRSVQFGLKSFVIALIASAKMNYGVYAYLLYLMYWHLCHFFFGGCFAIFIYEILGKNSHDLFHVHQLFFLFQVTWSLARADEWDSFWFALESCSGTPISLFGDDGVPSPLELVGYVEHPNWYYGS